MKKYILLPAIALLIGGCSNLSMDLYDEDRIETDRRTRERDMKSVNNANAWSPPAKGY